MSNAMMNHVRNIKTGSPIDNSIMRYLADCYNSKMGGAWPSQKRIAAAVELSIQSVRRGLDRLEKKGIITRETVQHGGKITRTYYEFIGASLVATTESIPTTQDGDRCLTDTNIYKRKGNSKEEEGTADHFEEIGSLLKTVLTPQQIQLFAREIDASLTDLFLKYARMRTARPNEKWQALKPALKFEYLLRDFWTDRKREITETLNEHKNNSALPTPAEREAADREARTVPLRTPDESLSGLQQTGPANSRLSARDRQIAATI